MNGLDSIVEMDISREIVNVARASSPTQHTLQYEINPSNSSFLTNSNLLGQGKAHSY